MMSQPHSLLCIVSVLAIAIQPIAAWSNLFNRQTSAMAPSIAKQNLLDSLEDPLGFNAATQERTQLVTGLTMENPTPMAGSTESFQPFAVGTWRIVYAPHIDTGGKLLTFGKGGFSPVLYDLKPDGIMVSHARYNNIPFFGSGWLSVSGTYSSEDEDTTCRVDFDKAWIRRIDDEADDKTPYSALEAVPESLEKSIIQSLGKFFFIDSVSVFPVSYLDNDTIVFDFELLRTRICARKIDPAEFL